jgi:hypothetical protein
MIQARKLGHIVLKVRDATKSSGLTIPHSVSLRADQVIECRSRSWR